MPAIFLLGLKDCILCKIDNAINTRNVELRHCHAKTPY